MMAAIYAAIAVVVLANVALQIAFATKRFG